MTLQLRTYLLSPGKSQLSVISKEEASFTIEDITIKKIFSEKLFGVLIDN